MDAQPKRYQLPLKQTLVLGIIGLVILAVLLRPTNSLSIPDRLQVTFNQGVNLRRGPSTKFNPPIGSYASGQTADILAENADGDWYKIRGMNGEGWVSAAFVTFSGDLSQIPVDPGPPIPSDTPVFIPTPTATLLSLSNANLVLGNVSFEPSLPLICGQTVQLTIDVANLGRESIETQGFISVKDYWNGQEQNTTTGFFPIIEPGQIVTIAGVFLTVSCNNVNLEHKLIVSVNPGNVVPESTVTDNIREYAYVLQSR